MLPRDSEQLKPYKPSVFSQCLREMRHDSTATQGFIYLIFLLVGGAYLLGVEFGWW